MVGILNYIELYSSQLGQLATVVVFSSPTNITGGRQDPHLPVVATGVLVGEYEDTVPRRGLCHPLFHADSWLVKNASNPG